MKILHVIPSIDPESGGPAEALLTMVKLAKHSGNDITVVATNEGNDSDTFQVHKSNLEKFSSVHVFPYFGSHSHKVSLWLHLWIAAHIFEFDVLHIHAAFSLTSSFSARQARKNNVPYVFRPLGTLSDSSIVHKSSFIKRLYFYFFEESTLLGASVVHVTSKQERESVKNFRAEEVRNVPVFTFEPVYSKSKKSKNTRLVDKRPIILGFLGRLHSKKNVDILIQSLKMLNFSEERFRLRIAGKGDQKYINHLEKVAKDLNVGKYIDWIGFVSGSDKELFFEHIDVFVSPSLHENFGIAAVEAMSRSVPCVLSKGHEFLSHSTTINCVFCDLSVVSVAQAIEHIVGQNDQDMGRMVELGREYIETTFSIDSVGKQLQEMYESAVS